MIQRRAFVAGMAAAVAAPLTGEAQKSNRPRIGWLTSSVVHQRNVDAFSEGMRQLGYGDIGLEVREARGMTERLPSLAAELVASGVNVIVTDGGPALVAAKGATTTIPIVAGATAEDLVREGIVASLARPGGNVTGFTISAGSELYGKRLELLRQAVPKLTHVGVVWNARNHVSRAALGNVRSAAAAMNVAVTLIEVRDAEDIERAIGSPSGGRVDGILTIADAFFWSQRARIVALVNRQRFPAMYPEGEYVEAGGLMGYGPNVPENFRRVAGYVDRILKGTNPGELPIELPTRFEFVINLKTAKALGLPIPPSLLLRADHVIE